MSLISFSGAEYAGKLKKVALPVLLGRRSTGRAVEGTAGAPVDPHYLGAGAKVTSTAEELLLEQP